MTRSLWLVVLVSALMAPVAGEALAHPGGPLEAARDEGGSVSSASSKVDVNRAGVEELTSLPGIGPALAKRIVEYRQENGPFRSVDDLMAVKGIGPKLLGKIRDRVTVGEGGKRS